MSKILILGANGGVGQALISRLSPSNQVIGLNRHDLDISDSTAVESMLKQQQAEIVINCAAFLNADRCEDHPQDSYKTNYQGVLNLIKAIQATKPNTQLIHFSTDFVFDGLQGNYTETDIALPKSTYGLHKWAADQAILISPLSNYLIFRIASVLNFQSERGDFCKAIVNAYKKNGKIDVVNELHVSVSSAEFIADIVHRSIEQAIPAGLYNCVANGSATWCDIAKRIISNLNLGDQVYPCSLDKFPYNAERPHNSTLNNNRLAEALGITLPTWQEIIDNEVPLTV